LSHHLYNILKNISTVFCVHQPQGNSPLFYTRSSFHTKEGLKLKALCIGVARGVCGPRPPTRNGKFHNHISCV